MSLARHAQRRRALPFDLGAERAQQIDHHADVADARDVANLARSLPSAGTPPAAAARRSCCPRRRRGPTGAGRRGSRRSDTSRTPRARRPRPAVRHRNARARVARGASMSARMSRAVAPPSLTMKFACTRRDRARRRSDGPSGPRDRPARRPTPARPPAPRSRARIRILKTQPALGSASGCVRLRCASDARAVARSASGSPRADRELRPHHDSRRVSLQPARVVGKAHLCRAARSTASPPRLTSRTRVHALADIARRRSARCRRSRRRRCRACRPRLRDPASPRPTVQRTRPLIVTPAPARTRSGAGCAIAVSREPARRRRGRRRPATSTFEPPPRHVTGTREPRAAASTARQLSLAVARRRTSPPGRRRGTSSAARAARRAADVRRRARDRTACVEARRCPPRQPASARSSLSWMPSKPPLDMMTTRSPSPRFVRRRVRRSRPTVGNAARACAPRVVRSRTSSSTDSRSASGSDERNTGARIDFVGAGLREGSREVVLKHAPAGRGRPRLEHRPHALVRVRPLASPRASRESPSDDARSRRRPTRRATTPRSSSRRLHALETRPARWRIAVRRQAGRVPDRQRRQRVAHVVRADKRQRRTWPSARRGTSRRNWSRPSPAADLGRAPVRVRRGPNVSTGDRATPASAQRLRAVGAENHAARSAARASAAAGTPCAATPCRDRCPRGRTRGCRRRRCPAGTSGTSRSCRRTRCRTRRPRSRSRARRRAGSCRRSCAAMPPTSTLGSRPPAVSSQPVSAVVVVLPCVPAITIERALQRNSSRIASGSDR